ncbi:hypothetical protein P170DRAFT_235286 [Aspergillus steynii IBT 23096]|uniref:Guanyl-nucleotide exchange factor n=1 Tax=Aspergillus steynii IBT 23096 TaxID=1392250 RepID=A0A2I2G2Q0_9EURO|nr:uncharacterized protein P170DRAFT_235286 [Aspergillus steynii IBT 23096]PLB47146.1 hypothetical protein P170DRAFT_235286 [Aspergillus steynii IBT 23096]
MHWKGLRIGTSDANDKKRTLLEPQSLSRHSEQLPRPTLSTSNLAPRRSESAPRSPSLVGPDTDDNPDNDGSQLAACRSHNLPAPTPRVRTGLTPGDNSSWRRNRFSFMRLRHASDPQLSQSYAQGEEDVPPVPSLPPPTIITTAPTSHEVDQPIKRTKTKFKLFSDSKKPYVEELPAQRPKQQPDSNEKPRHTSNGSTETQRPDPVLSKSQTNNNEEPGRLSTTSIRSSREQTNDSQRSSVTDARFSESSRSDQSLGDHGLNRESTASSVSKRFRMPRLKRNRHPLFPLPPKPTASQSAIQQDRSAGKPNNSDEPDHVSPLPSPSRSSVGVSAPRPDLPRMNSANSTHSLRSTPSNASRNKAATRARSSTLDSLANAQDGGRLSPHLSASGRTSTSTSGRKSFGDIFNITQRLRQNSEPPFPRNGSPGAGPGTPPAKPSAPSYPQKQENDTPATYLARLEETAPKSVIAGVLAQSNDEFYKTALRKYMRSFSFFGDPIDMAIRKLLMEVELPKETQQIDRFLQSFADRYHECNPGIFASTDQAYFIAFSILILHTDVFNKNNKRKMQKPDYVKNCRGEGLAEDILECFYENISYTPFIHIEDGNPNGRNLSKPRRTLLKTASSDHLSRVSREPVDPYTLIMDGKLDSLRPSLKDVMNLEDTYRCDGTEGPPDMSSLHYAFAKSGILQILSPRSRPDAFMPASMENPADSNPGLVDIKVAKVGLLWRKDPKKKRARSPWQEWGAVLTLSQLYFFKDVTWIKSLMAQHEAHHKDGPRRAVVFRPPLTDFKPDGIMSTDSAVALLDTGYKKHKHAFVFVRHNALEEVFLANTEGDMNDWLAKLNYASTFRTTGVRTQGMIATNYEAQRNRMSRRGSSDSANSHFSADREPPSPNPDTDVSRDVVLARKYLIRQRIREANEKLFSGQRQLDDLLRNARHLQVLTPVHARAREHVIMAAGRMAAKLKWVRQDIWRTKCYREVLVRDLGEDLDEDKPRPPPLDPKSLHLQIPTTNVVPSTPDLAEKTPTEKLTSPVDEVLVASPVEAEVAAVPESPTASAHMIPVPQSPPQQQLPTEARRPSVPVSITSSEIAPRAGRRLSADNSKERAESWSPAPTNRLEREASVLSAGSKLDVASLGSRTSKLTVPNSFEEGEERLLRETGLLDVNGSPQSRKPSSVIGFEGDEHKHEEAHQQDGSSSQTGGERMGRVRRSLHRTLRDTSSGHGNYPRSKKSRDSASSMAALEDDHRAKEGGTGGEGLSRKSASFTVHGKKASIVTFGSEWQNMPPEERLKLRKPTPSDEPRAREAGVGSSADSIMSEPTHLTDVQSLRSPSTATRKSFQTAEEPETDGSKEAAGRLYGEIKAKSDDALGIDSKLAETTSAASSLFAPVSPFREAASAPNEERVPPHSSADADHTVDENTPQKMPPSPPEQAVNA